MLRPGTRSSSALLVATVALMIAAPAPARATTFRFAATADTYTSAAGPRATHGRLPSMTVQASPRRTAYLRFRVRGLDASVARATLRLYARHGAGPPGVSVRRVRGGRWRERTLTYANARPPGRTVARTGSFAARTWVDVDVTRLVHGDRRIDVALTTRAKRPRRFATRESRRPPQLVVETVRGARGRWVNVVDDRFDSRGVPRHWKRYDGPYGSDPHNCASPSHVSVSGGALHLLMRHEPSGRCGPGWYTAGLQIARAFGGIDQRVTVRWRIVPRGVSSHRIIPMRFPDGNAAWPSAGEEDYCEGGALTECSTFLHFGARSPGSQVHHDFAFRPDLTSWHTVRFQRLHHVVTAWIDDLATPAWRYAGDPTTLPATRKRVVLQQECHSGGCPAGTAGSEDIQIDWITIDDRAPAVRSGSRG
jgi:hypothetical protein